MSLSSSQLMADLRRSSRNNKGRHSKRDFDGYLDDEELDSQKKRLKHISTKHFYGNDIASDDEYKEENDVEAKDESNEDENLDEGEVRCTPCGANKDNYDEETDEGGTMIECENCRTWQHAKCMGFRTSKGIPEHYKCNECSRREEEKPSSVTPEEKSAENFPSIELKLKDKTRASVARAFYNVFKRNIPDTSVGEGQDREKLAIKWALLLEHEVFLFSPKKDKRYTDKSRSLMVLIKKPNVMNKVLDNDLSTTKLVNSSPEEIDEELKEYAEKIRQESIRRSVLTVNENLGQRIKRTHKGEEIVENTSANNQAEEINVLTKNIDHRRFRDDDATREIVGMDSNHNMNDYSSLNALENEDDDEKPEIHNPDFHEDTGETYDHDKGEGELANIDDDELDFIIKGDRKPSIEQKNTPAKKIGHEEPSSNDVWSGNIVFPEFASFLASGKFVTCTNYKEPVGIENIKLHNRYISVAKEILSRDRYEVEGRLDKKRAEDYLNQIVSSRDLFLVEMQCKGNYEDFEKLCKYIITNHKFGVLSTRPAFVKDAYLLFLDGDDAALPPYLRHLPHINGKIGLFALYIVKKEYMPTGSSMLKSDPTHPRRSVATEPSFDPEGSTQKPPLLNSILSKLNGSD